MSQRDGEKAVRLAGLRLLTPARRLLARLRPVGTQRDRAGNRKLFFDQYVALLLLYFFTPTVTSLRSLQQASHWEQVRRKLGFDGRRWGRSAKRPACSRRRRADRRVS